MITPVTILTGFLGSGKTTLLAAALRDPRYRDIAVVVNEWGEAPIDHALLREASGNVALTTSGCICCRVAGDIVRTLRELYFLRAEGKVPEFNRLVIETTGLADPAPLAATLIEMPLTAARYSLSGIVTTVDALHGMRALDEHAEALKQVAMADRIVVTKADLAQDSAIAALEARLRSLAPGARLLRSRAADVDPASLFDTGLYRGERLPADAAGWLRSGEYRLAGRPGPPRHDASIDSFVWTAPQAVAWPDAEAALETICDLLGARLLRLKGLVHVEGEPGPRAVHAIGHTLYPSARLTAWPDGDPRTRLVFIGRELEESAVVPILNSFFAAARPR